jgi:Coenzyme PQQ synthesis protein D (PqqD)
VNERKWTGASPVPRPKPGIAHVEIEGERVLYDPTTWAVARLDSVGALLWTALDGEGTVSDLAADTAFAFGVEPDEALAGVLRLLAQLDQGGFLATDRSES